MDRIVIVGSSVAGVNCARSIRDRGFEGEVALVDRESIGPYDKPQLSKQVMAGRADFSDISLLPNERAVQDLTLLSGRQAVGIDVAANSVRFASGDEIEYGTLVIATGARARPSPWRDASKVYTLRSLADALALRQEMTPGRRMGIVGAGFIGAEVAATAINLGVRVTMIDPEKTPMARAFDSEIGQIFVDLHSNNGVDLALGQGVEDLAEVGNEINIRLTTGRELQVDFVLVGIGSLPNVEWLEGSGLHIDDGVLCGPNGLVTGQDNVYAIGDVSRWSGPRGTSSSRVEHWTNAIDQANCVAHNIMNPENQILHDPIAYVWSDQYDWKIQVAGQTTDHIKTMFRGSKPDQHAILFEDIDGRLMGAVTTNWAKAMILSRKVLTVGGPSRDVKFALQGSELSRTV